MKTTPLSFFVKSIIFMFFFFVLFWLVFKVFQQPRIYDHSLGKISKNYVRNEAGEITKEKTPYIKLTNTTAIQWDASHYYEIKENGYRKLAADGHQYHFAFFPLFPTIWEMTGLSPVGIVFFNALLFALGFFILLKLFQSHSQGYIIAVLLLSLPFMVIFMIPYTEALFYLLFICAGWGFLKKKYWIYFIAMTLVAMTRNAFTLIFTAVICAELIFLLQERKIKNSLKRLLFMSLPLLLGTGIVVAIQLMQGSDSILNFLTAQGNWGHHLHLPNFRNLADWSHESFGMNVPTIMMVTIPALTYVIIAFLKYCGILKIKNPAFVLRIGNREDYLWLISLFSCLSASCMVLLFQGGNLHGLSRFILASPYFAIVLCLGFNHLKNFRVRTRFFTWLILVLFTFVVIITSSYFGKFSFSYLGMLILMVTMLLYLLQDFSQKTAYKMALFFNFLLNVIWSTYLFNMYLSNGWIFA